MHDKFKKAHRTPKADDRLRAQIAAEAARRLVSARFKEDEDGEVHAPEPNWLETLTEAELYTAKRKAAAVLGRRVRPGDLPSDSEVRVAAVAWLRSDAARDGGLDGLEPEPEVEEEGEVARAADHLDRFTVYRMRLAPLESIKGDPRTHPEGDALYHSLQVFEVAREARPYDEDFLIAALLHDVGKGIEPGDHVASAVEALRGSISERTLWLIEHHHDLDDHPRARKPAGAAPEALEDLRILVEADRAGRVPGRPVEGLDAALAYLKGLEREDYLAP